MSSLFLLDRPIILRKSWVNKFMINIVIPSSSSGFYVIPVFICLFIFILLESSWNIYLHKHKKWYLSYAVGVHICDSQSPMIPVTYEVLLSPKVTGISFFFYWRLSEVEARMHKGALWGEQYILSLLVSK